MRAAHYCDDLETLLDLARTRSHEMLRPIEDDRRIVSRAKSTWGNTERGENRFGRTGAWFEPMQPTRWHRTRMPSCCFFLRANNGPRRTFVVPNTLAGRFGWSRKRLSGVRRRLAERHITMVRSVSDQRAALFRWCVSAAGRGAAGRAARMDRGERYSEVGGRSRPRGRR
jgi:hypothetical protein